MDGAPAHNKVCNIEDFADPGLREIIRDVLAVETARRGDAFPEGREYRKHWEVAMAVRALEAGGALREDAELLGVGAGNEPTLFYLTNVVRRVFSTDLYLAGGEWEESASAPMLTDPGQFYTAPWRERRLVVQHMDALHLRYDNDTFDGLFSSSSLEHFGGLAEVRQALDEMHRVLKPGAILSLSTEYRLAGPPPGIPGVLLFDRREIVEDLGLADGDRWTALDPLTTDVSNATRATTQPYEETGADVRNHVARHGGLYFERLEWSRYPHLVLRDGLSAWTSVHVALRKRTS
jgi:SAM-dependent methyltransferase